MLVIEKICEEKSVKMSKIKVPSIITRLAKNNRVGVFELYLISGNNRQVLLNAVAADDNPQDKAKEWSARRLALLYDIRQGNFVHSEYDDSIFVIDGIWDDEDVARLQRGGWSRVCRLSELDETLRDVFNI